jgi:hypothetical protein
VSTEKQKLSARKNGKKGGGADRLIDMVGKQCGDWTVLCKYGRDADKRVTWLCRCVCGTEKAVSGHNLRHGHSLGCGCTKKGLRLRPYEALYNSIARENPDKEILLSYEDFVNFTKTTICIYCGEEVSWTEFHLVKNGSRYNLDRKDNSLGYSKNNCVVCCGRCNRVKSNQFTYEQMLQIGALIKSWKNLQHT